MIRRDKIIRITIRQRTIALFTASRAVVKDHVMVLSTMLANKAGRFDSLPVLVIGEDVVPEKKVGRGAPMPFTMLPPTGVSLPGYVSNHRHIVCRTHVARIIPCPIQSDC
jgi:hypothetical protein